MSTTSDPASDLEALHPRRGRLRRYGVGTALGIAVLVGGAVWNSTRGVAVAPPPVTGAAAAECAALHAALPAKLLGLSRRATLPSSPETAAWGDPAVVLRCGVPAPAVLTPGAHGYDPTTPAMDLNGVCWVADEQSAQYVFTTVKQRAYVQLIVPKHYQGQESPPLGLASAIAKADPVAPDQVYDCS